MTDLTNDCMEKFEKWWKNRNWEKSHDTDKYAAEQAWLAAWKQFRCE